MKCSLQIVLAFFLLSTLISCGEAEVDRSPQPKADGRAKVSAQAPKNDDAMTLVKDRDYYKKWLPTAPMEDLGDAEQWNDFRLQFVWVNREDPYNYRDYLFSMRLDGSDIRMAASPDLLFGEINAVMSHFLRSPDNRYLIARFTMKADRSFIGLIDLQNKTQKNIELAPLKPRFAWSTDSKVIYYYADAGLMIYNVETGSIKSSKKDINSSALYPLADGNIVRLSDSGGYTLINELGDTLFSAPWPDKQYSSAMRTGVSPNLKYIYAFDSRTTCVYDLGDYRSPLKKVLCAKDSASDNIDILNDALVTPGRKGIEIIPFSNGKRYSISATEMIGAQMLRVINRRLGSYESAELNK